MTQTTKFIYPPIILLLLFTTTTNSQVAEPYLIDLEKLLTERYDAKHTYIHAKNTRHPTLKCETFKHNDSLTLRNYKPQIFLETIKEQIPEETNTIIISENHLVYNSRIILLDFIRLLKEKGYSTIYIEALAYDKGLSLRNYPTIESGFYLNEPIMGNLVRELLKEGFDIYPYEQLDFQKKNSENKVRRHIKEEIEKCKVDRKPINEYQYNMELMSGHLNMSIRDYSQYKNIMQTWSADKKSIILCGHGHGIKVPYGGWRPLGYWLSSNPNVKLYSIENSEPIGQEDSELNKLTCIFNQEEPYYLLSNQDSSIYNEFLYQPYENKDINGLFDMSVFYPIDYLKFDIKSLRNIDHCEKIIIEKDKYKIPFLIIKYLTSEYRAEEQKAIPIDIETVYDNSEKITTYRCENEIVFIWDGTKKHELNN